MRGKMPARAAGGALRRRGARVCTRARRGGHRRWRGSARGEGAGVGGRGAEAARCGHLATSRAVRLTPANVSTALSCFSIRICSFCANGQGRKVFIKSKISRTLAHVYIGTHLFALSSLFAHGHSPRGLVRGGRLKRPRPRVVKVQFEDICGHFGGAGLLPAQI